MSTLTGPNASETLTRALLDEIGHEFRTPLSSILGHQELLSEGILGGLQPKAEEAVGRIGVAAVQLTHLINGAVDVASLALGQRVTVDSEPVSLDHVNAAVESYTRGIAREESGIAIETATQTALVESDPKRLERVMILVVTAAAREVNAGLTLTLLHKSEDGASIRARLRGPGGAWIWAPDDVGGGADEVLRAAFAAVPDPDEGRPPGSWLRMAVAAVTAALLGGRLHFQERPEGSTLELLLPAGA